MWCDSEDHEKRECPDLKEAVTNGLIKFTGEAGAKKISYVDNDEPIPFNTNRGGMKALAEKRSGKRVDVGTFHADASVYSISATNVQTVESERDSESYKK